MSYHLFISFLLMPVFSISLLTGQTTTHWAPDGFVKIENGLSGLYSNIASGDIFGQDHDFIGDVDGDGIIDIVVGSRTADDGGIDNRKID